MDTTKISQLPKYIGEKLPISSAIKKSSSSIVCIDQYKTLQNQKVTTATWHLDTLLIKYKQLQIYNYNTSLEPYVSLTPKNYPVPDTEKFFSQPGEILRSQPQLDPILKSKPPKDYKPEQQVLAIRSVHSGGLVKRLPTPFAKRPPLQHPPNPVRNYIENDSTRPQRHLLRHRPSASTSAFVNHLIYKRGYGAFIQPR